MASSVLLVNVGGSPRRGGKKIKFENIHRDKKKKKLKRTARMLEYCLDLCHRIGYRVNFFESVVIVSDRLLNCVDPFMSIFSIRTLVLHDLSICKKTPDSQIY